MAVHKLTRYQDPVLDRQIEEMCAAINAVIGGLLRIPGPDGKFYRLVYDSDFILRLEEVA